MPETRNKKEAFSESLKKIKSNKATFIFFKKDISEALEKGYTVKAIWKTLTENGSITMSYRTMLRYTKDLEGDNDKKNIPSTLTENKTIEENEDKKDPFKAYGKSTFFHDSIPNSDDLY